MIKITNLIFGAGSIVFSFDWIFMSYIAKNFSSLEGLANGTRHYGESTECVASVKFFTQAGQTKSWVKGALVRGNSTIKSGTAIATFGSDGKYEAGHAAIFVSQDAQSIKVYDQWSGRRFSKRSIYFDNTRSDSNNGYKFYVIE